MNETLKKILLIACFGIITWLVIIFMISAGIIILVLTVIGLAICGAYKLWEDYAKKELLKREENFDILREENFDILKDSKKEEKE